jgi:hypothetical protein
LVDVPVVNTATELDEQMTWKPVLVEVAAIEMHLYKPACGGGPRMATPPVAPAVMMLIPYGETPTNPAAVELEIACTALSADSAPTVVCAVLPGPVGKTSMASVETNAAPLVPVELELELRAGSLFWNA